MKRKLYQDSDTEEDVALKKRKNINTLETGKQLNFNPAYFLRCHSLRKDDSADVKTQVWHCAFEPDIGSPLNHTNLVATCGGNSVCFIDVCKGAVKWKFYGENERELFYTISWSSIKTDWTGANRINILATGSKCLYLLHPENGVSFFKHRLKISSKIIVSSLMFHPNKSNILFGSLSNGTVYIWDIGSPSPPKYDVNFTQTHTLTSRSEVFTLSYCSYTDTLLAATNKGLCGWKISEDSPTTMDFNLPENPNTNYHSQLQLVDSVEALDNGLIASKCALHGVIYIWNLEQTLKECKTGNNMYKIIPSHVLEWSDTDNYFMNMGFSKGSGLLACGDDKGMLWLYDLKKLLATSSVQNNHQIRPTEILEWPITTDSNMDRNKKLTIGNYDIVMDKVALNFKGNYLVAVTSNNLVCIWQNMEH